jgi:hypothetical protein
MADIFRRFGPDYIDRFGSRMLPSHHRAIEDIAACRTQQMGGHLYRCENNACEQLVYEYHSCGNRSCPKCGQDKTQKWLETQQNRLLPTHYFLVTFTLPSELRPVARSNQKVIYNELFEDVPSSVWEKDWVVHCKPVGNGMCLPRKSSKYWKNNRPVRLQFKMSKNNFQKDHRSKPFPFMEMAGVPVILPLKTSFLNPNGILGSVQRELCFGYAKHEFLIRCEQALQDRLKDCWSNSFIKRP